MDIWISNANFELALYSRFSTLWIALNPPQTYAQLVQNQLYAASLFTDNLLCTADLFTKDDEGDALFLIHVVQIKTLLKIKHFIVF